MTRGGSRCGYEDDGAQRDDQRRVVVGEDTQRDKDKVGDDHSILVVLRPQRTQGEMPVLGRMNQGNDVPIVRIQHIHRVVDDKE